jgi:hypothetical protein
MMMRCVVLRLSIPRVHDSLFDAYCTNLEIGLVPNILRRYFFFTQIFYVTSLWTWRLGLLAREPKVSHLWSLHPCGLVLGAWVLFAGLCVVF